MPLHPKTTLEAPPAISPSIEGRGSDGQSSALPINGSVGLADTWARMEAASEAGDERGFVEACTYIDWTIQPPNALMRAVRLAIAAGAPLSARRLAMEGAQRHPQHAELQKAARILAPPQVLHSNLPPDPGLAANVAWLRANPERFQGRWVALQDGVLLKVASSFDELTADLGDLRAQRILATKVF
jgi:hypothetical protein